ncbi:hypothetical protein WJ438_37825 [Streptomyces sp. GD-15H]
MLLGWAAGLLIVLVLPWFEPLIARSEVGILDRRDQWRAHGAPAPASSPVMLRWSLGAEQDPPALDTVSPATCSPSTPAHATPGPHTARPEHMPVTPSGSHRPPLADARPRGTTSTTHPMTGD